MTAQSAPPAPSLQDCLNNLAEALRIVNVDKEKYYLRKAADVEEGTLKEIAMHFLNLNVLMEHMHRGWLDSRTTGPDAIEFSNELKQRIDIKLMETGKLDLQQLKRIMTRLNRADDALLGLNRIGFYLSHYKNLCSEKGLNRLAELTNGFMNGLLYQTKAMVSSDYERITNQISRCNLYYDNFMKSKTFRIASTSLLVSALSFLLSTSSLIFQERGSFQIIGFPQVIVLIVLGASVAFLCYLAVQWFER